MSNQALETEEYTVLEVANLNYDKKGRLLVREVVLKAWEAVEDVKEVLSIPTNAIVGFTTIGDTRLLAVCKLIELDKAECLLLLNIDYILR